MKAKIEGEQKSQKEIRLLQHKVARQIEDLLLVILRERKEREEDKDKEDQETQINPNPINHQRTIEEMSQTKEGFAGGLDLHRSVGERETSETETADMVLRLIDQPMTAILIEEVGTMVDQFAEVGAEIAEAILH